MQHYITVARPVKGKDGEFTDVQRISTHQVHKFNRNGFRTLSTEELSALREKREAEKPKRPAKKTAAKSGE